MTIECNAGYWDCECVSDFIHSKKKMRECPKCGAREEDQPDSRANEVTMMILREMVSNLREMVRHEEGLTAKLRSWIGEDEWVEFVEANHDFIFED